MAGDLIRPAVRTDHMDLGYGLSGIAERARILGGDFGH